MHVPSRWIVKGLFIFILAGVRLRNSSPFAGMCYLCVCIWTGTGTCYHLWSVFLKLGFTLAGTCAIFSVLEIGLTIGRLTVFLSNILTISFVISFFLLPFRNPYQRFGLFSASTISSKFTLIWSLDDVFGIVYFVNNSSIASETLVVHVFVTLTCQLRKWLSFAQFTMKPDKLFLCHVFLWSGRSWVITFVPSGASRVCWKLNVPNTWLWVDNLKLILDCCNTFNITTACGTSWHHWYFGNNLSHPAKIVRNWLLKVLTALSAEFNWWSWGAANWYLR